MNEETEISTVDFPIVGIGASAGDHGPHADQLFRYRAKCQSQRGRGGDGERRNRPGQP